jgi:hypothetical protein
MSGRYEKQKIKVDSTGEVTINLNLTIKLESDNLTLTTGVVGETLFEKSKKLMKQRIQQLDDEVDLIVPNIESAGLIDFGKKVED